MSVNLEQLPFEIREAIQYFNVTNKGVSKHLYSEKLTEFLVQEAIYNKFIAFGTDELRYCTEKSLLIDNFFFILSRMYGLKRRIASKKLLEKLQAQAPHPLYEKKVVNVYGIKIPHVCGL